MRIATLGPAGTHSERAARLYAANGEIEFADSIPGVFELVEEDGDLVGVVPVENSIEGVVTRTLDLLRESDLQAFTMSDIDARGVPDVVEAALDVATSGTDGVHVSLDMDWLDPTEAPGVGTPVRGGVSYREAHIAMEYVADCRERLRSLELVEVNPILDDHNQTAELACELAASAFGKRVL